ncbi:MAG: hypothetical protein JXA74_14005 [Anaerolineae bacterium]|nr:hypothetical protein [Anaerolineae bacterium]
MAKEGTFTKVLALAGTVLAWFPILATILTALPRLIVRHMLRIDYLMPAELFPFALVGGGLLLWAALRARTQRGLIAWGLALAGAFLVGGQALAVITGLASGDAEPTGWPWALVLASLALYTAALIELGVAGILLLRDLFGRRARGEPLAPEP